MQRGKISRSLIATAIFRAGNIAVQFIAVAVALRLLKIDEYGVWMTLSSVVLWLSLLDVGIGNGLRNKLANALANNDRAEAKRLVSSAYFGLGLITTAAIIVYSCIHNFLDWSRILNAKQIIEPDKLSYLAAIVVVTILLRFLLKLISTVYLADQRAGTAMLWEFLSNAATLAAIIALALVEKQSLLLFGTVSSLTPLIALLLISFFAFRQKYADLAPSLSCVRLHEMKSICGLGGQFFIIQIAVIVLFQMVNLIIANRHSPADVSHFQIYSRYYSIILVGWGVVMTPLWSAFTHALSSGDSQWARKTLKKLNLLYLASIAAVAVMYILAEPVIKKWAGDTTVTSTALNFTVALLTIVQSWNMIYAFYLNGVSETKIQIRTSIIAITLFYPLIIVLDKTLELGPASVVIAMACCLLIFSFFGPIATYQHINNQLKWKRPQF